LIYRAIGKAVVRHWVGKIRRRYGRQLGVLAAVGILGVLAGGYIALKSPEEG
jgi:hypothetical protein